MSESIDKKAKRYLTDNLNQLEELGIDTDEVLKDLPSEYNTIKIQEIIKSRLVHEFEKLFHKNIIRDYAVTAEGNNIEIVTGKPATYKYINITLSIDN